MDLYRAKALLEFTSECRPDMHEPDEQGFKTVTLVGDHLDNAFGEYIDPDAVIRKFQEYVLLIRKHEKALPINLATLIAFARIGAEHIVKGWKA